MSRRFALALLPSAFILALAFTGCGVGPKDIEEAEPLPRLFQNKDVWDLPIPMNSQIRPGARPGAGMGEEHYHHQSAGEKTDPGAREVSP